MLSGRAGAACTGKLAATEAALIKMSCFETRAPRVHEARQEVKLEAVEVVCREGNAGRQIRRRVRHTVGVTQSGALACYIGARPSLEPSVAREPISSHLLQLYVTTSQTESRFKNHIICKQRI
jgi:hypothetical protein